MQENSVDKIYNQVKSLDEIGMRSPKVAVSDSDIMDITSMETIGSDDDSISVNYSETEWLKLFTKTPKCDRGNQSKELKVALLNKLQSLSDIVVLPKELYYDKNENFIGYSMNKIDGADTFANYIKKNKSDRNKIYKAYMNLSKGLKKLHSYDIVVSALNNENFDYKDKGILNTNILIDNNANIHFCDADSFCIGKLHSDKVAAYMQEHYDALGINDFHYNSKEFDNDTLRLLFTEDMCNDKKGYFNIHNIENKRILSMNHKQYMEYIQKYLPEFTQESQEDISAFKLPRSTSFYLHDIQDMPKQLVKTRKNK